jgi:hypothetical protein
MCCDVANVSEVKFGWIERSLVNSNNGTPFLLTESPSFHLVLVTTKTLLFYDGRHVS